MSGSAVLSDDGKYRYALWRNLGQHDPVEHPMSRRLCLFVMLNPSTADASKDDATIRRCKGFASDWGYNELAVGNLFAYRATNPKLLLRADDPVGPDCDKWLRQMVGEAHLIVAAWGANVAVKRRERHVLDNVLTRWGRVPVLSLSLTSAGHPRHPLYAPKMDQADLVPVGG